MHNKYNYQCKICWNKALTFGVGSIILRFRTIVFTQYMQRCFQSKCYSISVKFAEGLHFSAFHYLGIDFSSNGTWDMHIKMLLDNDRKRVNQLHKVISNRNVNLSASRLLLLSVIRPSIEYGSEVGEGNKSQAGSLESIILDGAKRILGCSSKTCNEAVTGDMG